ncbi:MAG: pseudouridine synthase [Myxococcota bacterium]
MARERLQKLLAAAGVASRRGAESLIEAGRVSVNGRTAKLGDGADPERDTVELDGERLRFETHRYWVVNKPRGVLSTVRDPEGRPTVLDLLPDRGTRAFPVGRLDRDTEGLLLLTNDGELTHALLHPSHEVEREYQVTVRGELGERAQKRLARGVRLEEGMTAPAKLSRVRFDAEANTTSFHLTLVEGRKRQIRRALLALGHPVRALRRIRMGPLRLGRLPRGGVRAPTAAERRALEALRERARGLGDVQPTGRKASKRRPRKRKAGSRKRPAQ